MKKICFLLIAVSFYFHARAQFGIDVIIKQSAHESYFSPDAVESRNGNMFVAYLLDSAGVRGCELAMSTNSGINWQVIYRWFNPALLITKAAITSTDTGANEKVMVLITSQETIGYTGSMDLFYFNANNGYYNTSSNVESGITSSYAEIDIESDSRNSTGSENNVGFIVAYSGDLSDSVKYFCINSNGLYKKKVTTTGPGQLKNVHINYASNANFLSPIFMMAWEDEYGSPKIYMATTGTNPTPVGTIATMRVDDDVPGSTGLLRKPYVLTQNNGGLGPSGTGSYGLLHGLFYLRDSTGVNGANILGNVNKTYSVFTSLADSCNPENSSLQVGDYAAVNYGDEAHVVYFIKNTHHLRWRSHMDVIDNPSAAFNDETIPGGRINDIPSITEFPEPVVIYSPSHHKPGFFWVDNMGGRGAIKFDAPFIGTFSGIADQTQQNLSVFPNPVQSNAQIHLVMKEGWDGEIRAELIHINGQVSRQWTCGANHSSTWNLSLEGNLAPGFYILRVTGKNLNSVTRLVVQ